MTIKSDDLSNSQIYIQVNNDNDHVGFWLLEVNPGKTILKLPKYDFDIIDMIIIPPVTAILDQEN